MKQHNGQKVYNDPIVPIFINRFCSQVGRKHAKNGNQGIQIGKSLPFSVKLSTNKNGDGCATKNADYVVF